jgi:hypothetical protein
MDDKDIHFLTASDISYLKSIGSIVANLPGSNPGQTLPPMPDQSPEVYIVRHEDENGIIPAMTKATSGNWKPGIGTCRVYKLVTEIDGSDTIKVLAPVKYPDDSYKTLEIYNFARIPLLYDFHLAHRSKFGVWTVQRHFICVFAKTKAGGMPADMDTDVTLQIEDSSGALVDGPDVKANPRGVTIDADKDILLIGIESKFYAFEVYCG